MSKLIFFKNRRNYGQASSLLGKRPLLCAISLAFVWTHSTLCVAEEQSEVLNSPQKEWAIYIEKLRDMSSDSALVLAKTLERESYRKLLNSERGNLGLSLSGSYTEFPDGLGQPENSTDILNEYSTVRLNFRILDQILHRSGRVAAANARVRQADYTIESAQEEAAVVLARESAQAWAEKRQYQALSNALSHIQRAKDKLNLSAKASLPDITNATPENQAKALILYTQVTAQYEELSPFEPQVPLPPLDYTVLPQLRPTSEDIVRVTTNDPRFNYIKAQIDELWSQAEAHSGNGIDVSIFAGHTFEDRAGDREDGPSYGVQLTLPLGFEEFSKARALKLQAQARSEDATYASIERQRSLLKLRTQWSRSAARLNNAIELMRQQKKLLSHMKSLASRPKSGRAPQPWELDIEETKFWLNVADTWRIRGEWLSHLLAWSVVDPQFLADRFNRSSLTDESNICAPLASCE